MERIGIAASKIAKGNIYMYNLCVISISFIFSFFLFIIAGSSILFALIVIGYIGTEVMALEFERSWPTMMTLCMITLTIIIGVFNLMAIMKNIKFQQK